MVPALQLPEASKWRLRALLNLISRYPGRTSLIDLCTVLLDKTLSTNVAGREVRARIFSEPSSTIKKERNLDLKVLICAKRDALGFKLPLLSVYFTMKLPHGGNLGGICKVKAPYQQRLSLCFLDTLSGQEVVPGAHLGTPMFLARIGVVLRTSKYYAEGKVPGSLSIELHSERV